MPLFVAIAGLSLFGCLLLFLLRFPNELVDQELTAPVDVAFVFAGGRGERMPAAIKLLEKGLVKQVIANLGAQPWAGQSVIRKYCDEAGLTGQQVSCVTTAIDADNTAGEAVLFAEIARNKGFENMVLVTTSQHVYRARLRMMQCSESEIYCHKARGPVALRDIVHEIGGLVEAVLIHRRCQRSDGK